MEGDSNHRPTGFSEEDCFPWPAELGYVLTNCRDLIVLYNYLGGLLFSFWTGFTVVGSWNRKEVSGCWTAYFHREATLACNFRICLRAVSRASQPKPRIGILIALRFHAYLQETAIPLWDNVWPIATVPAAGSPAPSSPPPTHAFPPAPRCPSPSRILAAAPILLADDLPATRPRILSTAPEFHAASCPASPTSSTDVLPNYQDNQLRPRTRSSAAKRPRFHVLPYVHMRGWVHERHLLWTLIVFAQSVLHDGRCCQGVQSNADEGLASRFKAIICFSISSIGHEMYWLADSRQL
jgi:hypothetical protein